jgi:hypothetical protein
VPRSSDNPSIVSPPWDTMKGNIQRRCGSPVDRLRVGNGSCAILIQNFRADHCLIALMTLLFLTVLNAAMSTGGVQIRRLLGVT